MIRKFTAETEDAGRKAPTTGAETLDGIARAGRGATGDANPDEPRIPPARRPGRHPSGDPCARRAPGIEGRACQMYIEYVTYGDCKVLHQLRKVERGADAGETMENAVKRLEATGFTRTGRMGGLEWSDGYTDARIRPGSPDGARAPIARHIHEYSFLN